MPVSVSKYVRTQLVGLLSDPVVGFNSTLAEIVGDSVPGFQIDFSSTSKNFLQGWFAARDVIETSTLKLPLMCLYSTKSQNTNDEKFATFSGEVEVSLDTYLSFKPSQAQNNTDDLVDALEGTFYTLFNTDANQKFYNGVSYNGDIMIRRYPVYQSGQNWIQMVSTSLAFYLTVS